MPSPQIRPIENHSDALEMAQHLVKEDFVACVNILDKMTSVYKWQGDVQVTGEVVLIAKVSRKKTEALITEITRLHKYEMPCAIVLPIEHGTKKFISWVKGED